MDYGSGIIDSCNGGDIRVCDRATDFERRSQNDGGLADIGINVVGDDYVYNYKLGKWGMSSSFKGEIAWEIAS